HRHSAGHQDRRCPAGRPRGAMTMSILRKSRKLLAAAILAASAAVSVHAGEVRQVLPGAPEPVPAQELVREAVPALDPDASEVQRFCSNIADAARGRRYVLQAEELKQLQGE